jgi:hypothetical protein
MVVLNVRDCLCGYHFFNKMEKTKFLDFVKNVEGVGK